MYLFFDYFLASSTLADVRNLATSAEWHCWSSNKKKYLGVTANWIEKTTGNRMMALLVCDPLHDAWTLTLLENETIVESLLIKFGVDKDKIRL